MTRDSSPTTVDEASGGGVEPTAWSDEPPSHAVAAAIASQEGEDTTVAHPLYESIDTEAMDKVLRSAVDATLTFTHLGYEVTVTGAGEVSVSQPTE